MVHGTPFIVTEWPNEEGIATFYAEPNPKKKCIPGERMRPYEEGIETQLGLSNHQSKIVRT
jgi:hypothetical protein